MITLSFRAYSTPQPELSSRNFSFPCTIILRYSFRIVSLHSRPSPSTLDISLDSRAELSAGTVPRGWFSNQPKPFPFAFASLGRKNIAGLHAKHGSFAGLSFPSLFALPEDPETPFETRPSSLQFRKHTGSILPFQRRSLASEFQLSVSVAAIRGNFTKGPRKASSEKRAACACFREELRRMQSAMPRVGNE